jgi:hypothetical protein
MSPVGFEPTISASGRPHTYALDRATNGIDKIGLYRLEFRLINELEEVWTGGHDVL